MSFTNKAVVVTGAASGLGVSIALSFAKLNASLCIVDINDKDLLKTKEECEKLSKNKVLEVVADLRKDEDIERIVDIALRELKRIDVLVNCAGIYRIASLQHPDLMKTIDEVISVNFRGTVAMTKQALPALIESKGCVVNLSSIASTNVITDSIAYAASKAGVTNFTKNAAFELAKFGVRVNCISPGSVQTNILKNAGVSEDEASQAWDSHLATIPLKKHIKVEEIAEMVVYLAGEKASCITGSDFVIDGGTMIGASAVTLTSVYEGKNN